MALTIDKFNYKNVSHSSGEYEGSNGTIYPFAVEIITETDKESIVNITWLDSTPSNSEEVEFEIKASY